MHINPLKPRIVAMSDPNDSSNEAKREQPMPWRDAAAIALILTLGQIFIVFMPMYGYASFSEDVPSFLFELVKFAGQSWFASFLALSGLSRLMVSRQNRYTETDQYPNRRHHPPLQMVALLRRIYSH